MLSLNQSSKTLPIKMNKLYDFIILSQIERQSPTKQAVSLPIVDQQTCAERYSPLGIFITDNQLCAGGVYAQDTCDGDSGNPLMKVAGNHWIIEGIVSFGRGCGLESWAAVYTRVESYDRWIRSNLRP